MKLRFHLICLLPGIIVALLAPRTFGAEDFVYTTPAGVAFHVTADGLSSIRFKDRDIASGHWSAFNAEGWFKDGGTGAVKTASASTQRIERINDRTARVYQVVGDVSTVADYSFDGEDLTLSTRLENHNADAPLNIVGFSGLTFNFARPPDGLMMTQHITYFQAHGVSLCHPGQWSRIGGSYAIDDSIGVGVSPWKTGLMRSLILWDYADWNEGQRETNPKRNLIYFAVTTVPPRGAATIDLKLRVSPDRDWKHLLAPYREHFTNTFGPVQYKADMRWIATDYLNHSQQAIGPTNPYGFQGQHRRIDTPDGANLFCDTIVPSLKDANGQGVIVWGQGGEDPRGGMYRPDFDVLPPEVESNWPKIQKRLSEAGLKLGVCTRPRHMAVRENWKEDQIIDINPDDAGHREMLWHRFEKMITGHGCTLFYLDSFGDSFEDVKLMKFLREKMGPNILTFCEHQNDAIFCYSGGYSETSFSVDSGKPAYRLWSGDRDWQIYQWLAPGSQMTARLYEVKGAIPPTFTAPDEYFMSNRITPLVPVSDFIRVPKLKELQHTFIDAGWRWK